MTLVIDAAGLKVGRFATIAAKTALRGDDVVIVNCEQAVLTGRREVIYKKYHDQYTRGRNTKGPFQQRMADRFVRRIIRSMLPYETPRGRDAFRRVKCFIGNPHDAKAESIEAAHISQTKTTRFVTVKELCQMLGGRNE